MGRTRTLLVAGTGTVVLGVLAGCTTDPPGGVVDARPSATPDPTRTVVVEEDGVAPSAVPPPWVTRAREPGAATRREAGPPGEPRTSYLTVPALGLRDVAVQRYRGSPDAGPGTATRDTGLTSSRGPRGPRGPGRGVGPGEVGNVVVTGHRTSDGAPLADLASLGEGARIELRSGERLLVYRVTGTRRTSYRSPASLRAPAAPAPGRPGAAAPRAVLTLSTCATPEDHAVGNHGSDEHGEPEQCLHKIAVLVGERPA